MGGGDGGGGNFCCGQILHYYISTVTDANLVTVHNKQTKLANSTTLALITVGTPNAYSVTTYCECIAELATYDKFIYYVKPVKCCRRASQSRSLTYAREKAIVEVASK